MNAKQKKIVLIGVAAAAIAAGVGLGLKAFSENLVFFFSPTQVAAHEVPEGRTFRIGGLVEKGSVKRLEDGVTINFVVTDTAHSVNCSYRGVLPDLFGEGQGVVAQGMLDGKGTFVASQVLAKHDENYMPPEAAKALDDAHKKGYEAMKNGEPMPKHTVQK